MKRIFQIVALILAFAFINVIVGKTIHEITEHNHLEEICHTEGADHFHEFEFAHPDLICDFNFSSSLAVNQIVSEESISFECSEQDIYFSAFFKHNIYLENLSLRGPPTAV